MKQRVLAAAGAGIIVMVAILIRGAVMGSGGSDGGGSSKDKDRPVVACTPEVAEVCAALADDGRIAADPPTLDLAGAADPDASIDGWITWDLIGEVANLDADPKGTRQIWGNPTLLGSTQENALLTKAAQRDLGAACADAITWACIATNASDDLSVGVGRPNTAEGLARLLPLARALTTDDDPADLDTGQLRTLIDSPATPQDAAETMAKRLVTTPGSVSVVVAPRSVAADQANSTQGTAAGVQVQRATPIANRNLVLVPRVGVDGVSGKGWCDRSEVSPALEGIGVTPCSGTLLDPDLAGFLYRVREKVG